MFKRILKLLSILIFIPLVYILLLILPDVIFHFFNHNYPFKFEFSEVKKMYILSFLFSLMALRQKIFFSIIIFISIFLEFTYFNFFGKLLTPYDILLFFQHINETFDGLSSDFKIIYIPLLIVIICGFIFIQVILYLDKYSYKCKYGLYLYLLGVFSLSFIISYKVYVKKTDALEKFPYNYSPAIRNFLKSINYLIVVTIPNSFHHSTKTYNPSRKILKDPKVNIIFIIGESFRAKNAQILGYDKENMPNLTKMKNNREIVVKTAISAGTMTKVSVSYMINQVSKVEESDKIYTGEFSLFKLAKNNGFYTFFATDQSKDDFRLIYSLIEPKSIHKMIIPEHRLYDKNLLKIVTKIDLTKPTFLVLQMSGSHIPYKEKYPLEFNKFKSAYDNSILYTDYVLSNLFKIIKNKKNILPTYIFFVSDHGEMLGERGLRGHGHLEKEVYMVPFIYTSNHKNQFIDEYLKNKIITQYEISQLISKLIGYEYNLTKSNIMEVVGKDIEGYAGYKILDRKSLKEIKLLYK